MVKIAGERILLNQNMRVIFGHDWREDGVMRAVADFAEAVAARAGSVREGSDGRQPGWTDHDPKPRMLNVVPTGKESLSRTALEANRDSGGVLRVIPIRDLPEPQFELLLEATNLWDDLEGRSGSVAELTALRIFITEQLDPGCRICLGGKTTEYMGGEPGVMEEARLALRFGKPLYLMGGFGGASRRAGRFRDYWNTENGLNEEQKRELFETTDVERGLRLISAGIQDRKGFRYNKDD